MQITRSRNKWKFYLKDGIMNLSGKDYVFQKANGDAEWWEFVQGRKCFVEYYQVKVSHLLLPIDRLSALGEKIEHIGRTKHLCNCVNVVIFCVNEYLDDRLHNLLGCYVIFVFQVRDIRSKTIQRKIIFVDIPVLSSW